MDNGKLDYQQQVAQLREAIRKLQGCKSKLTVLLATQEIREVLDQISKENNTKLVSWIVDALVE